ncbi:MAG TPA: exodeoxyribonuclease III [Caulobacteraceae bacterium]|jgi:exodeoxyribonuclease-3|nr:exodeoxyribonuclease III [Caulobacteraceae bacterium]
MRLRLTSWNINSVRMRADQVRRFVAEAAPDVLCLQEIKCREGEFPVDALVEAGLPHLKIAGQKGWHGVAIASRWPLEPAKPLDLCREGHARCVSATVAGMQIHNLYAPAGGDTPDRVANPKFDHKLDYYARLTAQMAARDPSSPLIVTGDLNIAPSEFDVWNHRHMSKVVSHTPVEVEAFAALMASMGFVDAVREVTPEPEKLFSWWSYRAIDFRASNRGLRLDHVLLSPGLARAARTGGPIAAQVHDDVRGWEKPSDHAPVTVELSI